MTQINTNFEEILLKSLILETKVLGRLPFLEARHFHDMGNQKLFELLKVHFLKYGNIPSLTELAVAIKNVPNAEVRKNIIHSLTSVNTAEVVKDSEFLLNETVEFVKDSMYHEALLLGADALQEKNDDKRLKSKRIMEEMSNISIDSDLGLNFDDIEEMIKYYSTSNVGILSSHHELNMRLGAGFLPGTLSVILAGQGIGKSLLMTDLLSSMLKDKKNILMVSLEMGDKEIMKRVHSNAMDLPINSLGDLSKSQGELKALRRPFLDKESIRSAYNKLKMSGTAGDLYIKDYAPGHFSASMLESLIQSYKVEKNIEFDIIFVDYLGIMKSDLVPASVGLYSYVKSIGEEVRAVAKKMILPIVSASQLNRGAVNNTEADNSNVSDSIGTAATADFMLFLLQNEEMKAKKEIVCKVTKNRFNGRTDTWMMGIDYEHMRFYDLKVQGADGGPDIDIFKPKVGSVADDFGIITPEKMEKAVKYADEEIRAIEMDDSKISSKENPFVEDNEALFQELGI